MTEVNVNTEDTRTSTTRRQREACNRGPFNSNDRKDGRNAFHCAFAKNLGILSMAALLWQGGKSAATSPQRFCCYTPETAIRLNLRAPTSVDGTSTFGAPATGPLFCVIEYRARLPSEIKTRLLL